MLQCLLQQLDLERLPTDHALERCDLGLILLEQVGRLDVAVQCACLILADPDPDQLPRDVMPLRQAVQGLSG